MRAIPMWFSTVRGVRYSPARADDDHLIAFAHKPNLAIAAPRRFTPSG